MNKLILFSLLAFSFACSPESPKELGEAKFQKEQVSELNNKVAFNPKVDILFVIDNSGSMAAGQANLITNIERFTSNLSKLKFLNFHIGVLASDMDSMNYMGKLQGTPRFVTGSTPNMEAALAANMNLGTYGSGTEYFYEPVQEAFSSAQATWNKDFYRADATLALIFITDAAEQSLISSNEFYDYLVDLKKDANKILAYGVIKTTWELATCPAAGGEGPPTTKIEKFLNMVSNSDGKNGNILSLCSPSYGDSLAQFALDIAKRSTGVLYLNRVPVESSIKVMYGKQVIPNNIIDGWTYDPTSVSLRFGDKVKWQDQGPNTEVAVTFDTRKDKN